MHTVRVATAGSRRGDREIALFLADHEREPALAVAMAQAESRARDDIFTNDVLAWALLQAGRPRQAKRASSRALRLGTQDATLHYHAGAIAAALDRPRAARRHLRRGLALNPRFDLRHAVLARTTLDALSSPTELATASLRGGTR